MLGDIAKLKVNKSILNKNVIDRAFIAMLIVLLMGFYIFPEALHDQTEQETKAEKIKINRLYEEWHKINFESNNTLYSFKKAKLYDRSVVAKYKYTLRKEEIIREYEAIFYKYNWNVIERSPSRYVYKKDDMLCIINFESNNLLSVTWKEMSKQK